MNYLSVIIKVALGLPTILEIIEKAFDGKKDSSAEKKQMAKTFVKVIVSSLLGMSGKELDAILKMVDALIDPFIDLLCTFLFPHDDEEGD